MTTSPAPPPCLSLELAAGEAQTTIHVLLMAAAEGRLTLYTITSDWWCISQRKQFLTELIIIPEANAFELLARQSTTLHDFTSSGPSLYSRKPCVVTATDALVSVSDLKRFVAEGPRTYLGVDSAPKEPTQRALRKSDLHRARCQALAAEAWDAGATETIEAMIQSPKIKRYGCEGVRYTTKTLRGWIADLAPTRAPGRPRLDRSKL